MNIKLSKSQWERIGFKSNWYKLAYEREGYYIVTLGEAPSKEMATQVGGGDFDSLSRNKSEVYLRQLQRQYPDIPENTRFIIRKRESMYSSQNEVAIEFKENDEASENFAFGLQENPPKYWDKQAKLELTGKSVECMANVK